MLPVLAPGFSVALGSSAPQQGPKPVTFEEMVNLPVAFEGRHMISLPPQVPRRALRFESAPENRGPASTLPWVNLPGTRMAACARPGRCCSGRCSSTRLGCLDR